MDQRGFDNQPSAWLDAASAAALLGVKLATLYAYASRGLLRSAPGTAGGRARRYLREDLLALRARHDARSGHGPVAAGALRFGEPVLDSRLTQLTAQGPVYRGRSAVALAREGASFESVAEHLWASAEGVDRSAWTCRTPGFRTTSLGALLPAHTPPIATLGLIVPALGARDDGRFDRRPDAVLGRARALIARMACALALPASRARFARALAAPAVSSRFAHALGARADTEAVAAIDRALVLCADHELNASTFAARVAASAGADVYACLAAALATLSGPLHGGACNRVEALLAEAGSARRAPGVVRARLARGEALPGFGRRLYPSGDPRALPLLEAAREIAPRRSPALATVFALIDAVGALGAERPTVDLGLVALSTALELPPGSAVGLFAIGRTAGWVAHVLEQYESDFILRPRARYVGGDAPPP